ncbi:MULTISPECIES: tRNA (adenine(22)-N(1))-methyltransferase TrmK [unclassified Virgibacillus]|uniref:tRNA (adenine(22)-N(1))-methyltransferase n=1 Tax=unclassified Virgibacillus TaxID=2620237 RepID=UPI00090A5832|nr:MULTISPECIES: tRNA (adenine(22)-N(1))-methyltransferase TrmK [unclassified Virgibacillus]API90558.1 SAM-dependent methyltransferase [Virgibacillus sp. 6R]MBS7429670.1 tRNA (adenine(22)-N(1))-methyltransferase TrmK [Virgibacillus sp. 19R1-5]
MNVKISKRLEQVASFLPKGAIFADIGSDHAYLPCYVCQKDPTAVAIAGEVNKGPYQRAVETVQAYSLQGQVEVRHGNGLEIIQANEVQQVVIAGMGGTLIRDILDRGKDKLPTTDQIIAQPNVDARAVRKWLGNHGFTITDEDIIEENGHCYEIINAKRLRISEKQNMDEKALLFGPLLLRKKPSAFYKKWEQEANKLERVLEQINQATKVDQKKQEQFMQEWRWMKEVIQDEK